jgi:hypothetical protein
MKMLLLLKALPEYGPDRLDGGELDTLLKLSKHHPAGVDDGDVPAKTGRDGLVTRGYARRDRNGFNYATAEGLSAVARYEASKVEQPLAKATIAGGAAADLFPDTVQVKPYTRNGKTVQGHTSHRLILHKQVEMPAKAKLDAATPASLKIDLLTCDAKTYEHAVYDAAMAHLDAGENVGFNTMTHQTVITPKNRATLRFDGAHVQVASGSKWLTLGPGQALDTLAVNLGLPTGFARTKAETEAPDYEEKKATKLAAAKTELLPLLIAREKARAASMADVSNHALDAADKAAYVAVQAAAKRLGVSMTDVDDMADEIVPDAPPAPPPPAHQATMAVRQPPFAQPRLEPSADGKWASLIYRDGDGKLVNYAITVGADTTKQIQVALREPYRAALARAWDSLVAADPDKRAVLNTKEVRIGDWRDIIDTKRETTVYNGARSHTKKAYPPNKIMVAGDAMDFNAPVVSRIAHLVGMPSWSDMLAGIAEASKQAA